MLVTTNIFKNIYINENLLFQITNLGYEPARHFLASFTKPGEMIGGNYFFY